MRKDDLKALDMPDQPGVYVFRNKSGRPLYVGKAASLRDRVKSYFASGVDATRGPLIAHLASQAETITWQTTDSVLEALMCEANMIKEYQPPFNVDEKDNKSFNYVVITKEKFPRILVVRGRELFHSWNQRDIKKSFGPFPHGGQLKEALKIIRKIFPYADKCTAGSGKPCFNRQIGLCPGVCSGEISKEDYAKIVRHIMLLFSGKMGQLKKQLGREMKRAVKNERFEEASKLRYQLESFTHIQDVSLIKDEHRTATGGQLRRIEAYDVAHTAGKEVVGVMAVVLGGEPQKSDYRKFKIKNDENNDIKALSEMLLRRIKHTEWPYPRVIAVDGGKGQVNAAERVLQHAGIMIPVVGVVKDEFHRPERLIGDKRAIELHEKEILLANNEAHRFGITYHRRRLRKRAL